MYIVAITGGIGSGKTTVANHFAALDIDIVDADVIARQVVAVGSEALAAIAGYFGHCILLPDGQLDRRQLRERVFNDEQAKSWLNQLLHPLIRQKMQQQCQAAHSPYCILVVPLLVENKLMSLAQRILVVDVSEQTQIERTSLRDGITPQQAKAIMAAQASREERLALADDIINNNDSDDEMIAAQVYQLHQHYLTLAKQSFSQQ